MKWILLSALFAAAGTALWALPSGYGPVKLGMGVDAVKSALLKDGQFGYRGDRDVSISPSDGETVIETDSAFATYTFFDRCWFQFADGKLATITLNLDADKIDHYSVFSTLCEKYGNPDDISPKKSVWKDGSVLLSLEKPLTLRYVDAKAFADKQDSSNVDKTTGEKARDSFLKGL